MDPICLDGPLVGVLGGWRHIPEVSGGLVGGIRVYKGVEGVFDLVLLGKASVFTKKWLSLRAKKERVASRKPTPPRPTR